MPKITITIEAELNELEAECFHNNMIDEDLNGQADKVKDILREWNFATIDWKVLTERHKQNESETTFRLFSNSAFDGSKLQRIPPIKELKKQFINPWRLFGAK